jgi:hypothetical protein
MCAVCHNLEQLSFVITPQSLRDAASQQCATCQMLERGLGSFIDDFDHVKEFQLLVDSSLFVEAVGKENKRLGTVEFYSAASAFASQLVVCARRLRLDRAGFVFT